MEQHYSTNFPDEKYLQTLVDLENDRVSRKLSLIEKLVMYSGASVNCIGSIFTDPNMQWQKQSIPIEKLILTRTNPKWNAVIIDLAKGSPTELKKLMQERNDIAQLFSDARFIETPILVLARDGLRIFDGMHRTVAAIRDNKKTITAWVATPKTKKTPKPAIEPHVIYDFLRAYQVGSNKNREGLITALRFLKEAYGNVEFLLEKKFGATGALEDDIQSIIKEVLD